MSDVEKPHLSSEYYKARKNYNLFASLLFIWEFIGVDIPYKPWAGLDIVFKTPKAAPYVIICVLLFYAIRFTIEWFQSDGLRREYLPSRIDYFLSHIISAIAIILYFVQIFIAKQVFLVLLPVLPYIFFMAAAILYTTSPLATPIVVYKKFTSEGLNDCDQKAKQIKDIMTYSILFEALSIILLIALVFVPYILAIDHFDYSAIMFIFILFQIVAAYFSNKAHTVAKNISVN